MYRLERYNAKAYGRVARSTGGIRAENSGINIKYRCITVRIMRLHILVPPFATDVFGRR
jgi:hypothetical protein